MYEIVSNSNINLESPEKDYEFVKTHKYTYHKNFTESHKKNHSHFFEVDLICVECESILYATDTDSNIKYYLISTSKCTCDEIIIRNIIE